ncbi:macro domain-containing protein [Actinomadura sp. NEAU-AAG7]|uniref:macro domain-containing protein n=1 Tax=Actinomadura sp. NEAU-AAG7 TaxID=2839640 RepID=UPI001BE42228|nr:macro domain-containing protein [Actinomadura sp. NEAU-AAG7]MBT2207777.1 hypothetical protein [Actinomadura sp. NEAU-AAG7]
MSPATALIGVGVPALACALLWWLRRGRRTGPGRPLDSGEIRYFRFTAGAGERYVGIVCGDIRRARCAEVWVNSENTSMEMARVEEFSVSSIVRYEGARRDATGQVVEDLVGHELARATAGRAPLPAATAVMTGAGMLARGGVRRVVHVAAVQGEPGGGFRQVREIGRCVTNALAEVERADADPPLRSVLFPLLGVGQGGGDVERTVRAMLGAVLDFHRTRAASGLQVVYLLAYTDRELAVCDRVLGGDRNLRRLGAAPEGIAPPFAPPFAEDAAAASAVRPPSGRRSLQMGFVVDVMGYGRRGVPAQERVQERLARLVAGVLLDCGVSIDTADKQWTGDGFVAFLPSTADPTAALPQLLASTARRLAADNGAEHDRVRLRMAVGIGLIGPSVAGFSGSMVVGINRLVDSPELRAAAGERAADLAVLVSDHLYDYVIKPGYLGGAADEFTRVHVQVKEFAEQAWLWTPPKTPEDA